MARREPTRSRRPATREPSLRVLLVCGSERTESEYFKGLRSHVGARSVSVKVVERPSAPDQVVRYARDHCGRDDFDETWCAVDVDRFEVEGAKVSAAHGLADSAGIRMATSNPCFELWLLLHHEGCTSHCDGYSDVEVRLKRFVSSYDKTRLRFDDYADGVLGAVARAKRLDPTGVAHDINPSSAVWVLVEKILKAAV